MRDDLLPALETYLASLKDSVFGYGAMDCALFAGGWVKIATGTDPLASFAKWSNEDEARAVIGSKSLADLVTTALPPRGITFARLGDIVAFKQPEFDQHALGICMGRRSAFLCPPPKPGMGYAPTAKCGLAWSVL